MPKAKTAKAKATTAKAKAKPKSSVRAASRSRPSRGRTRPVSKAKPKARSKQRFTASHFRDEDFQIGLRSYAAYRDLGISHATGGMVQAHVIRFVPPCRAEEVSKLHYHEVDFQMVYVLKGWIKSEFDEQGAIVMRTGSCWIQPPRIEHKVLDYSDDCEVLEIILPADFKTVELE
jgi:mannose-6-phosphate isomerase-like protein (cupin superfamily)